MTTITEQLISRFGFKQLHKSHLDKDELDLDQFTCILRIHEIHYLFYSEDHKAFTIGVKIEHPKKDTTGKLLEWKTIMIPKVIYNIGEAENLLKAIITPNLLNAYC